MKKKLTLISILLISITTGISQKFSSPKKPSLIGFHYSLVDYNSPELIKATSLKDVFDQGDIFKPGKQASAFTISYWKGLTNSIDFSAKASGIFYDYTVNNNSGNSGYRNEFGSELEGSLNFRPLSDAHFFQPFLTVGIGGGYYTNEFGANAPLGIGFQFNVKSALYVLLQTQYRFSLTKDIFPNNLFHSLGIAVNIGREKPAAPPPPPLPPPDRDNDGIVDSLDACPDQAGPASLNGCPDRDSDGIADRNDSCPDVAGLAKYQGCPVPDTDKDGINDEQDKCPDVAGVARYQGCPVPDTDKDGVNDEEDKCPNQAGPSTNFGCPVIDVVIVEKINQAAKNIFFATGSAKLLAKSYASLNNVVTILNDNPTYKVDVDGHTDTTGSAEKNQVLSENRANSVKAYLTGEGIDESRITSTGYGVTKPIASNKTAAGRAKNRRVEMKLRNY